MQTSQSSNSSPRPKIGVYYPCFLGGGAEAVALWMLEALKDEYDVTLFTFSAVNFEKLNLMYGTNLSNQSIKIRSITPRLLNSFCNFLGANSKHSRQFYLHSVLRLLKVQRDNYDLLVSAYNAVDLGKPGMQYIHWPKVVEGGRLAIKYYRKLSDFSVERLKKNISIVNSKAVAQQAHKIYGVDAIVIYPPVVIEAVEIPWEQKENAFICSGRLVEAKQPHKVIQILKAVRDRGFDIKLYLTGGGGGSGEQDYTRYLQKMVDENSSWVKLCKNLSYQDYSTILYKCRYGIHYKKEPFGISIAEMVKAGAIPFVKSSGGQVEIVGQQNIDLLFDRAGDAVDRIIKVLSDTEKQNQLCQALNQQKELFSTETFIKEIRHLVKQNLIHL